MATTIFTYVSQLNLFSFDAFTYIFTDFEGVNQTGIDSSVITLHQKTKIREYVEEVVAKLLGGSLDQIRVTQLSKSENSEWY